MECPSFVVYELLRKGASRVSGEIAEWPIAHTVDEPQAPLLHERELRPNPNALEKLRGRAASLQPQGRSAGMSHYQIAVAIGSLRRNSYNRQLANAIKRLAPEGLSFYDLRIDDLPLY